MIITHHDNNFPYVTIENTYSDDELQLIWEELTFLCNPKNYLNPEDPELFAAKNSKDRTLKNNKSFWLDTFYTNRNSSHILNFNRKIFLEYSRIFKEHPSWIFKNFECNMDTTLFSYYENGDYYDSHKDNAFFTCLTWFYKEPKKFSGGDLYITCENTTKKFEIKNNYTIIFPSILYHKVSEVKMPSGCENEKLGRFTITQFLLYK